MPPALSDWNFHVLAADGDGAAGDSHGGHDHNGGTSPELIASAAPVSVRISADVEDNSGVNVRIMADGWRWAPELVDQEHTPGAGHGHIYVDGEKIARVFGSDYHIGELTPGRHEIRVTLNTNNHGELTHNGQKVEAITTVNVPDVGQAHNEHGHGDNNRGARPSAQLSPKCAWVTWKCIPSKRPGRMTIRPGRYREQACRSTAVQSGRTPGPFGRCSAAGGAAGCCFRTARCTGPTSRAPVPTRKWE